MPEFRIDYLTEWRTSLIQTDTIEAASAEEAVERLAIADEGFAHDVGAAQCLESEVTILNVDGEPWTGEFSDPLSVREDRTFGVFVEDRDDTLGEPVTFGSLTEAEADALLTGIEFVNDSAISARKIVLDEKVSPEELTPLSGPYPVEGGNGHAA